MFRRISHLLANASPGWRVLVTGAALAGATVSDSTAAYGPAPQYPAPQYPAPAQTAPPYATAPTLGNSPITRAAPAAQAAMPVAPRPAPLPEPIYWRQHLFLIPYQWGSAAESGVAQSVWLFVSKDRGATWRKISEAKPDVKAFNYRSEADGEYWFAVRTIDRQGRAWPAGAYQPELRVIVDTTLPNIDELRVRTVENGRLEIRSRATDLNLDPNSWRFEWQADPSAAWQPVTLQAMLPQQPGTGAEFQAYWQPSPGTHPIAVRGTVSDRAGNSATYQTRLDAPAMSGPLLAPPATGSGSQSAATAFPNLPTAPVSWPRLSETRNGSVEPSQSTSTNIAPAQAPSQPWAATTAARAPFQLWTASAPGNNDGVTAYGNPPLFNAPPGPASKVETVQSLPHTEAHFAAMARPTAQDAANSNKLAALPATRPQFSALEPYREQTATPPPSRISEPPTGWRNGGENNIQASGAAPQAPPLSNNLVPINSPSRSVTPIGPPNSPATPPTATAAPKLVGSRTFALEYDLDNAGAGVSRVELWGTRDSGQTWTRYAQDDDSRSPIVVTVDEEGIYGFRIVVQTAGSPTAAAPRPGDAPELWVAVDLKRPTVELTAIERGQGNIADHLILHWRASDNNLEQHPISIFYSSQPTGPWSAIATNLDNTGEYAWRVERFVPSRFYLRIEAHDTAGNLAAFQTREPIEFSPPNLAAGHLRAAEPISNR